LLLLNSLRADMLASQAGIGANTRIKTTQIKRGHRGASQYLCKEGCRP
jgi:hypothetical protein